MLRCNTGRHNTCTRTLPAIGGAGLRLHGHPQPREYYIQGLTPDGKNFRPSDWAERLACAMSSFRPGGAHGKAAYIGYSSFCVPRLVYNVKCVLVNEALRDIEPMAWDSAMHFARDNQLKVVVAGEPEPTEQAGSVGPNKKGLQCKPIVCWRGVSQAVAVARDLTLAARRLL